MEGSTHVPLIVVGSGPAGLTAALYAARARVNPLVIRGPLPGGQVTHSQQIDNFPGFPEGISGFELATRMEEHASTYGARFHDAFVTRVDLQKTPYRLYTDDGLLWTADALILCTGATPRALGVPGESLAGVEHCATCDGPLYADRTVVVVGGGSTAFTDALQLSHYAREVLLVHRSDRYRAEQVLQEQVQNTANIQLLPHHTVQSILGTEQVQAVQLKNAHSTFVLPTDAVFVCIGSVPNTWLFEGQLRLDQQGLILTNAFMQTSLVGVYAAGEVQESQFKQAITSAGDGARAALHAIQHLHLSRSMS